MRAHALAVFFFFAVIFVAAVTGAQNNAVQPGLPGPAPYPAQPATSPEGQMVPVQPATGPDQPVVPQTPAVRPAPQAPPPPPFTLSPEEEAQLDSVLRAWQEQSSRVKTFRCAFVRFEYDKVFGPPNQPRFVDRGEIAFGAPDKGAYSVKEPRQEHWICDGKAVYEYDYQKRRVTEFRLPPELQGKQISNGPLPFLFGAPAGQLKHRYYLRLCTPPDAAGKEVWLQAFPRFQQDAANFSRAELILTVNGMNPIALQIHHPGGNNRTSYRFEDILVNDPLGWLKGDPFRAITPFGWQRVVEEQPKVGSREQPQRQ